MPSVQPTRNVLALLGAFVVSSMAVGVLAAGLAIPAVGATGVLTKNSVNFFDSLPSELATPPLSIRSKLLDADGNLITTFYDENRVLVTLDKIAPVMQDAIISIEDSRFYKHGGVDPEGLARAAVANQVSHTTAQGASTLTQQYVKNVLLETSSAANDKTAARKIQEIRYAVSLEKAVSKPEILNRYLNIVPFSNQVSGVESAAKYYFGTSAAKLKLTQAAMLAGMVQAPSTYNPRQHPKEALARRNVVIERMFQLKKIDQATRDKAIKSKLGLKITATANGCANAKSVNAFYCEYVRRQIIGNKDFSALGKTDKERENALMRGGLTIQTALKPKIVNAAWKALSKKVPPKNASGVSTATVTVEPGTGKVFSIMQNSKYSPAGKIKKGYTAINYSVDHDWGGGNGFQTGSTFKPLTLAAWLQAGKSLNTVVRSTPGNDPFSAFTSCGARLRGSVFPYGNSADSDAGSGTLPVWLGTAKSVNGVYISMEKQLDLCKIRDMAEKFGLHLAKPRDDICKKGIQMTSRLPTCAPALTLGIEDISPMTMAAAYAGFAADGMYCKPISVTSIKDRNGKSLKVPSAGCKQVVDKKIAQGVNLGLSHALKPDGTAGNVRPLTSGQPASGKTGTTNSSIDTWFVGYTPQLATAVWVGDTHVYGTGANAGRRSLNGRTLANHYYTHIYGSLVAAPMWKEIMTTALEGSKIKPLNYPPGVTLTQPVAKKKDKDKDKGDSNDGGGSTGGGTNPGGGDQGGGTNPGGGGGGDGR
jgi:membrane peptidoglycan carboxypeptidase